MGAWQRTTLGLPVPGRFLAGSWPVRALPFRRGAYFAAGGRSRLDAVHFWRCAPGLLGAGGRSRLDAVRILQRDGALAWTQCAPGLLGSGRRSCLDAVLNCLAENYRGIGNVPLQACRYVAGSQSLELFGFRKNFLEPIGLTGNSWE